jgi:uncharacterized heparinase superfamily protein
VKGDLVLLLRSLPHLRPSQPPQRIRRLAAESALLTLGGIRLLRAHPNHRAPGGVAAGPSPRAVLWDLRPGHARRAAEGAAEGEFELLGARRAYRSSVDWQDREIPRLARFELNAFGFAWPMARSDPALFGPALAGLVESWERSNPPRRGDAWHPFVVAERLLNLIGTLDAWLPHARDPAAAIGSLRRQARFLQASVEWDVGGNHVIRELAALLLTGVAFGDRRLAARASGRLAREVERQVLPDGGHVERSPAYHLQVLTDLAEASARLPAAHSARAVFDAILPRMATFAASMCHPDGSLAMFNDCYEWPVPPADYLSALGLPADLVSHFPDTGYHAFGSGSDRLFVDAGVPSPPDLPPHAHCDLLSVEVSAGGQRMIVNSGTGQYERGDWRDYWRSTRAHNTVEIDGAEQSEVWHSFRMARRAAPFDVHVLAAGASAGLTAAHDGYRRLTQPAVHRRTVVWSPEVWAIVDGLEGHGRHRVRSLLHLHPEVSVSTEGRCVTLRRGQAELRVIPLGPLPVAVAEARSAPIENWHSERLGRREPSRALVLEGPLSFPSVIGWTLQSRPSGACAEANLEATANGFRLTVPGDRIIEAAGPELAVRSLR